MFIGTATNSLTAMTFFQEGSLLPVHSYNAGVADVPPFNIRG